LEAVSERPTLKGGQQGWGHAGENAKLPLLTEKLKGLASRRHPSKGVFLARRAAELPAPPIADEEQQGERQMSKRVSIYARVSTEDQAKHGYSLPSQMEACRKYAEERGWAVVDEISDEGVSGAALDRPGLDRIRDMAQAGEIDSVLVYEMDRLSRKLAHQLIIEEELGQAGVSVHYVLGDYEDTDEGRLMKQIRGAIAEFERAKIRERMRRGRRACVKSGDVLVHGCSPYGYHLQTLDGKRQLAIDEEEARVVRLIFHWYVHGDDESGTLAIRGIAKRLTELEVPTRGDKQRQIPKRLGRCEWAASTIANILKRETYCGTWHYGKKKCIKNGSSFKVVTNPSETWITLSVPAIIDRETWEAAQVKLRRNKDLASRNTKYQYLLSRRLTCGRCGYKMHGKTQKTNGKKYQYYLCPGSYDRRSLHRCDLPSFSVSKLDTAVWEWLQGFLLNPENLRDGLQAQQAAKEEANRPLRERLGLIETQLAEHRQQMDRLIDLYLAGGFPKDMLVERKARLERIITSLESEQVSLQAQLEEVSFTNEDIDTIEEFAAKVRIGLDNADYETRRRLIDLLDVQLTLNIEDGQRVAYIRCILGENLLIVSNTSLNEMSVKMLPFAKPASLSPFRLWLAQGGYLTQDLHDG
jgi:site-specific DNA recombinase